MSQTTIESLNKDVLLEVFKYLDGRSLKTAALTCETWSNIIGTSVSTMKKLPLIIGFSWHLKFDELISLKRHFHSIIFDRAILIDKNYLVDVFSNIAQYLRYVEMRDLTEVRSSRDLLEALSMVTALEKLVISRCFILNPNAWLVKPASFKSLRSFVFDRSGCKLFEFMSSPETQIRELKLVAEIFTHKEIYQTFMKNMTKLESLAIQVKDIEFFKALPSDINFQLKRLSVYFKHFGKDSEVDTAFISFLDHQRNTLEELELDHYSEKMLHFILTKLKLRKLIINSSELPITTLFYGSIRPNRHLKVLVIEHQLSFPIAVRGILSICPALEKLVIKDWTEDVGNEMLIFIADNFKHLKHLEVPTLGENTPERAIPSLKTFIVHFIDNITHWQTFVVNNPSLEVLSLKFFSSSITLSHEVLVEVTTRLQKLKKISVGVKFNPSKETVEMMNQTCESLKLLEVLGEPGENENFECGSLRVNYYPHSAVKSIFRDEPTLWDFEDLNIESSDEESSEGGMERWDEDQDNEVSSSEDYYGFDDI